MLVYDVDDFKFIRLQMNHILQLLLTAVDSVGAAVFTIAVAVCNVIK